VRTLDRALARYQSAGREHEAQRARFAAASERQPDEAQPIEMEAG
jgi:hypothetical protein